MPWGLSAAQYDLLVERYDEVFGDLLEYQAFETTADEAIAAAAEIISDAGGDPFEVLSKLIDEREEAATAYGSGMSVDWDISEYADYGIDDEWFYYH